MIGLIPAAGLGTRLGVPYPKELLPVTFAETDGRLVPRPVVQASLDQMRRAGVDSCLVIVAEWKLEILRVLGDGADAGVPIGYVVRSTPRGLPDALDAAWPWMRDTDVCMTLPDTIVTPPDALARVAAERAATGADVVLGVFPTDRPEQLGPVRIADDGAVVEVQDKPAASDLRNTWGMAVWSPRFTALLHAAVADATPVLGALFQRAVDEGLRVRAVRFDDGGFVDVGTPEGLAAAIGRGPIPR